MSGENELGVLVCPEHVAVSITKPQTHKKRKVNTHTHSSNPVPWCTIDMSETILGSERNGGLPNPVAADYNQFSTVVSDLVSLARGGPIDTLTGLRVGGLPFRSLSEDIRESSYIK
jgi:hypothetical protein